jgi:hypothetical protein
MSTTQHDPCQRRDCRCTQGAVVLGVDASHLYVLLRTASTIAYETGDKVKDLFLWLIDAHQCGGSRILASSDACMREEVTGPRADGRPPPELASVLTSIDAAERIKLYSDCGWHDLPAIVPLPVGRNFGERDRRLAAATDYASETEDADAWLVTDDEDFVANLLDSSVMALIAVYPVHSAVMLLYMYDCGVLNGAELECALAAEQDRLETDLAMRPEVRALKQDRLDRLAVRLGRGTAS